MAFLVPYQSKLTLRQLVFWPLVRVKTLDPRTCKEIREIFTTLFEETSIEQHGILDVKWMIKYLSVFVLHKGLLATVRG